MKSTTPTLPLLAALGLLLVFSGRAFAAVQAPDTTPDGLARVKKAQADMVYRRPGVSFAGYTKILLVEPTIAFRKDWQLNIKFQTPTRPVTSDDMQKMIVKGKGLLIEEFAAELTKAGYTLATGVGPDVLAVKPMIYDLDIYAPEPDDVNQSWAKIYTHGVGEATLVVELFDSVSGQVLARAYDQKSSEDNHSTWLVPRNQVSNIADARRAFSEWAKMLAEGLNRAKAGEAK
jgi:hypothetical protein